MSTFKLTGQEGALVIEREIIEVNYLSDLDENWRYTDHAGHEHHCEYRAADHYPTLTEVIDETYWCGDCDDEHERSHLECRLCGETIRPGTTGPGTKYIPGLLTCTFNGEPVTREQAEQIIAAWRPPRSGQHGTL